MLLPGETLHLHDCVLHGDHEGDCKSFEDCRDELDAKWRVTMEQNDYLDMIDNWHPSMGYSADDPKRLGPGGEW
jgi:hypothetical protein